jgi:asparagine synthase (glutamine-hydrolysing)
LEDWERIELDEVDLVGPIAASVLRRHGVLWPANAHFHVPMLARATHGSLLTGIDGDVLFGGWRWAPPPSRTSMVTRAVRDLDSTAHLIFSILPGRARDVAGRRAFHRPAWIHPTGWREVVRFLASVWELEPRRWDARVAWWHRRRYLACGRWSLSQLAEDHDVRLGHPLLDPAFLAALAGAGARRGYGDRTSAMTNLFGDLLPSSVLSRADKATFDTAIWAEHSRRFVGGWDGEGVDASLVDVDALRREWDKPVPHFQTATLLQTAWLHASGAGLR